MMGLDKRALDRYLSQSDDEAHPEWFDDEPPIRNKAFRGAYRKGRQARREGKPITTCPYNDLETQAKGGVAWSVAFANYWCEGWEDERISPTPPEDAGA